MAPSIINNNAVQGETFIPGQIFVFGGFALRANSLGHLEQIDSYAPSHQVRFGNLNYTADIHGDLIFNGFGPVLGAPNSHDEHDLDLLSDNAWDIAPTGAPDLNPEQIESYACHAQYATLSKRNSKVPPRIDPHIETLLQGGYHYINIT